MGIARLGALGLAAFAFASPAIAAPHWTVDAAKSRLGFSVQWGGQPFAATFKKWRADIAFDPDDLAHSSADVVIEVASESSGDDESDEGVKGAQGFQVAQFATARFVTTRIVRKAGDAYVADAKLTIRGITRPVSLPFTLAINGNGAHMVGSTDVSRMDFGVGHGGDFGKPVPVAYEVKITVDLVAAKGP